MFKSQLQQHLDVFALLNSLAPQVEESARVVAHALSQGKKVLFVGNGGSAADAQHIAAELVGRLVDDRPALAALALTTDSSALTSIANDYGYEQVFSRQIAGLGQAGDVLIAISTSGNSPNIIAAVQQAKSQGIYTIGWLGKDGGQLKAMVDLPIVIPSSNTARIQEAHIFIGHVTCALVEAQKGYGQW